MGQMQRLRRARREFNGKARPKVLSPLANGAAQPVAFPDGTSGALFTFLAAASYQTQEAAFRAWLMETAFRRLLRQLPALLREVTRFGDLSQ